MIQLTSKQAEAIEFALLEYDKETILDIQINEGVGWGDRAEPLNNMNPVILAKALFDGYEIVQ